jgi:hypothetical protein
MPRSVAQLAIPKRYKHGQHIFFWKQIHTNQVLYSFTRELDVRVHRYSIALMA